MPDADDLPFLLPELTVHAFVAGHVVFALSIPESAVGFRAGVTLGAAVPKPTTLPWCAALRAANDKASLNCIFR